MNNLTSYMEKNDRNLINLSGNESFISLENNISLLIKNDLSKVELNRYPEVNNEELNELYAKYIGSSVTKDNIISGNGSDEVIDLALKTYVEPGHRVLTIEPDFCMYDLFIATCRGISVKFKSEEDGFVSVDKFIEFGKKEKVDVIILSNPNNPTGFAFNVEEIEKILTEFKDNKVIIDEAYYEFYGKSIVGFVETYKNLIVTRTLSKAWGLAAIRIGFLISAQENIEKLKIFKIPYSISSLDSSVAKIILKEVNLLNNNSNLIIEERERLFSELKTLEKEAVLPIKFFSSKGNYIYGKTPYKTALLKGVKKYGILIRDCQEDSFRISVGAPLENKRLIECIKSIFTYGG